MSQYLSHIKLTSILTSSIWPETNYLVAGIVKGLRKVTVKHQAQILSRKQIRTIIYSLLEHDRVDLCRFIVVAYHYMFRVQSELFPLQVDGMCSPGIWHSRLSIRSNRIEVTLATLSIGS